MPITDGLDQAIADAVLTLLDADNGPPPLVFYDGVVGPKPDFNAGYVLVYTTIHRPIDDPGNAQDGRSRVWVARWVLHCVSSTAKGARGVAQRARAALLDVRPTVAGFTAAGTGQIRMDTEPAPPQPDEQLGSPVMDAVQTYRLRLES